MAWIIKPRATEQIDRRDQPYLTDAMKQKLEAEVLLRYPTKRAATLPVLHEIQHEHNWIPAQAVEEAAAFLELSPAEVFDTATFYEEFFLEPKGKYLVQVCQSISCELCGHESLLEKVQDKLDIIPGETTEDGRITLMMVECLGSCDTAPVAMINGKRYDNVTWEQFEATLDNLPDDPAAFNAHGPAVDHAGPEQ
jgi:NADH-quinone oxidoreductase subunit E